MKTTTANLFIEVNCKCPYCDAYLDIFDLEDVIARNPKDYSDQWLIGEQYFKDNFERSNQAE